MLRQQGPLWLNSDTLEAPQYNEVLRSLFMNAPVIPFERIVGTFREDFGCHPDDMFLDFERTPVASASIAQVHRAKLHDGTVVAVK
jgi:aarF domain-containing kinase